MYKKLVLTWFIILRFINLPFYNDPVFTRWHVMLLMTFGIYLNLYSIINVAVVWDFINYDYYFYYLILLAALSFISQLYYLLIKKKLQSFLTEVDKFSFRDYFWGYFVWLIFVSFSIGFAIFSSNLFKDHFL